MQVHTSKKCFMIFEPYKYTCSFIANICCLLVFTCAQDPGWNFPTVFWHYMTTILCGLKFSQRCWLRWQSFGIWHFVELGTVNKVVEGSTASVFKMVKVVNGQNDGQWTWFSLRNTTESSKKFILLGLTEDYTGQQNLTFFGTQGKISAPNITNAEFKHVHNFSPSPTFFCDSQVNIWYLHISLDNKI
jgi:hypothetical protein